MWEDGPGEKYAVEDGERVVLGVSWRDAEDGSLVRGV